MAHGVPTIDAALAAFSTNFNTLGVAASATYGLTADAVHHAAHRFISAYNAAKGDGTRSKSLVMAKNDTKRDLRTYARELYGFIQLSLTVTNEAKTAIGVVVRDFEPSPVPPLAQAPILTLIHDRSHRPLQAGGRAGADKLAQARRRAAGADQGEDRETGSRAKPHVKIDPKLVTAARELRDRYLERVNRDPHTLAAAGKYAVGRALPDPV